MTHIDGTYSTNAGHFHIFNTGKPLTTEDLERLLGSDSFVRAIMRAIDRSMSGIKPALTAEQWEACTTMGPCIVRHMVAALALYNQPFGLTMVQFGVSVVHRVVEGAVICP